jgi:signal transduction histidine kinase
MDTRVDQGNPENPIKAASPLILVVDDDSAIRDIVSYVLREEGFAVIQAANGEAALSLMQQSQPDLILSDVTMPGMDGFEFYRKVRATAKWFHIPFIFLSARGLRSEVRQGMDLGADDYLAKPFEAEELVSAVRVRLTRAAETQTSISRASGDLRDTIMRTLPHEFRTPLSLIVGYADLLETDTQQTSEQFHDFLQGLRTGVTRLNNLVEDFLLLNKLEAGSLTKDSQGMSMEIDEPDQLVRRVIAEFAEKSRAANVQVALQAGAPGVTVVGDILHISGIVGRLLDNAIKFSKKSGGHVWLTTRHEEGYWVLEVADEGIGMRPEAAEGIFEAFRQIDRLKMEQQGAGLGLAIVRGLVQLYNGTIDVESELGQGSKFTVWLPVIYQ